MLVVAVTQIVPCYRLAVLQPVYLLGYRYDTGYRKWLADIHVRIAIVNNRRCGECKLCRLVAVIRNDTRCILFSGHKFAHTYTCIYIWNTHTESKKVTTNRYIDKSNSDKVEGVGVRVGGAAQHSVEGDRN